MSDFDDFFAKKLDEEASFPNRAKNWKQMSKRLDAFDSGTIKGNPAKLRYWQIATLAAVTAAAIFFWKTRSAEQENRSLRQEIAALQNIRPTLQDQVAELGNQSDAGETPAHTTEVTTSALKPESKPIQRSNSVSGPIQALTHHARAPRSEGPLPQKEQPENIRQNMSKASLDAIAEGQQTPATSSQNLTELPAALQDSAFALAQETPGLDSVQRNPARADSLLAQQDKLKDSIATAMASTPEIKPVHLPKKRFRIGAQGSVGFVQPKQKGVTVLRGQGFTVEAKIFRSLWLAASADWLHHEVSTENFVSKFHPHHDSLPKPPDGGGGGGPWQHPAKLVMVESAPRQQYFGLALRYAIPIHFWLRPSIRVAHDWVHISPTLVTYKFVEDDPGGPGPNPHEHEPEYTAEKFDAQWLSNQWRFGIGLEKELPNWAFGLWADYSKDFSSANPSFDVLYLRAGAQYRF